MFKLHFILHGAPQPPFEFFSAVKTNTVLSIGKHISPHDASSVSKHAKQKLFITNFNFEKIFKYLKIMERAEVDSLVISSP